VLYNVFGCHLTPIALWFGIILSVLLFSFLITKVRRSWTRLMLMGGLLLSLELFGVIHWKVAIQEHPWIVGTIASAYLAIGVGFYWFIQISTGARATFDEESKRKFWEAYSAGECGYEYQDRFLSDCNRMYLRTHLSDSFTLGVIWAPVLTVYGLKKVIESEY